MHHNIQIGDKAIFKYVYFCEGGYQKGGSESGGGYSLFRVTYQRRNYSPQFLALDN